MTLSGANWSGVVPRNLGSDKLFEDKLKIADEILKNFAKRFENFGTSQIAVVSLIAAITTKQRLYELWRRIHHFYVENVIANTIFIQLWRINDGEQTILNSLTRNYSELWFRIHTRSNDSSLLNSEFFRVDTKNSGLWSLRSCLLHERCALNSNYSRNFLLDLQLIIKHITMGLNASAKKHNICVSQWFTQVHRRDVNVENIPKPFFFSGLLPAFLVFFILFFHFLLHSFRVWTKKPFMCCCFVLSSFY